ncbi:MAG: hypothetical protein MGG11_03735 [Trichodesmium sp. MAG_R03]|nr:hypothetical protein [Trichodesmium sp. MAG_R03]
MSIICVNTLRINQLALLKRHFNYEVINTDQIIFLMIINQLVLIILNFYYSPTPYIKIQVEKFTGNRYQTLR